MVAGFGVSGFAAADNLTHLGAAGDRARRVRRPTTQAEKAELLEILGADGPARRRARPPTLPDDVDLVVTSPGWRPTAPLLAQAARARHPGLGRGRAGLAAARPRARRARGCAVTGTNGKTTTVQMLDVDPARRRAAQRRGRQRRAARSSRR